MKKTIYQLWMPLMLVLMAAACDDKNDSNYVPGEPAPANCMTVYFDSSNSSETIFEPGGMNAIEVTLSRKDATQAAEIPIICKSASDGLTIPATASFAAGEMHTAITISFGTLEVSKKYSFSLAIDDAYVDHYAIVDGSATLSAYVMAAAWNVAADNVTMKWTTLGVQNTWTTRLERLGETNRYRFQNFLDSGVNLVFTVSGNSAYTGYECIHYYANCAPYEGTECNAVYLYDDAADDYPTWTVQQSGIEVADICLMETYGNDDYSYISFDKRGGQLGTYFTDYTDGQYDYYNYVTFTWPAQ